MRWSAIVVVVKLVSLVSAQFFSTANSVQPACLGNILFAHGNYIRKLKSEESEQIKKYKEDMTEFQRKLKEAFAPINFLTNTTAAFPLMPTRPSLPSFCTSNETTLYILGACTIQNHKVYVGNKYARELTDDEKIKMDAFAAQLSSNTYAPGSNATPTLLPNTAANDSEATTAQQQKVVFDFCQEF